MMKIEFVIKEFPKDLSKSYALDSYTEGVVSLSIADKVVFKEEGILIVELYLALNKWIEEKDEQEKTDFIYESMDFEESPILAFMYEPHIDAYKFDSVWKILDGTVSFQDIKIAYEEFKKRLSREIFKRSGYELNSTLSHSFY